MFEKKIANCCKFFLHIYFNNLQRYEVLSFAIICERVNAIPKDKRFTLQLYGMPPRISHNTRTLWHFLFLLKQRVLETKIKLFTSFNTGNMECE